MHQSPRQNHTNQGFVTMDTQNDPLPRAVSLESFRKHMDATLSSRKSTKSTDSNFGGSLRKTKSDSDVAMITLKKKVEVSPLCMLVCVCGGDACVCVWGDACVCVGGMFVCT